MQHLRSIADLDAQTLGALLQRAEEFQELRRNGERIHPGLVPRGAVVAMVFEKPSLRTKVAFEVAAASLEAVPVFLSSNQILASGGNQSGRESIPDIGRNLERFADVILARVYSHETISQLARTVRVPVVNLLCDLHHPTQALADLMAIRWHFGKNAKIKVAFVGDGNNVATSLMEVAALSGLDFAIASPVGYEIPLSVRGFALEQARRTGSQVSFHTSPEEAVRGADVIYTDTFVSMGQEGDSQARLAAFSGYQVTERLLNLANRNAKFMHCLPAHRGEEVSDTVIDHPNSIVFDQAECRLHIAKALLERLLGGV